MADREALMSFPYLQLDEQYTVGPWIITPLSKMKAEWRSTILGIKCQQLLRALKGLDGEPVEDPTVVVRRTSHPEPPSGDERLAEQEGLKLAVEFALLRLNATTVKWTAENASFHVFFIDPLEGQFVTQRGGIIRQWTTGLFLDDPSLAVPPPEDLVSFGVAKLDAYVLEAAYRVTSRGLLSSSKVEGDMTSAIHWFGKAWNNSRSWADSDRLIFFRTSLEALAGTHKSSAQAPALDQIYAAGISSWGVSGLLGTLDPQKYERIDGRGNKYYHSPFEHWLWFLADQRNRVVHDGMAPVLRYSEPGSPFQGHLLGIAGRVAAELITIRLSQAGYPFAIMSDAKREEARALAASGTPVTMIKQVPLI
ncbi:hypothetical protein [Clavibacter michiganensis]|uniref:hypothetical protein n=1 Tax=Clavibacter michiganensis TaxID=28447 RepID=UPI00130312C6|nr:hypothetical protein [Clavibacter michiganensis]KAF0258503.1 hypothetical protein DOU02_07935 [Clavibacter michiganensis subsp. michiganensis]